MTRSALPPKPAATVEALERRRLLSAGVYPLASFPLGSDGVGPTPDGGVVADAAGDLFGVTEHGGPDNVGAIFEVPVGSSAIDTLYPFTGGSDGAEPAGPLWLDAAGNLYGVTRAGGADGHGTIFELPAGASAITTFVSSTLGTPNGGLVADAAGDLFGTTSDTADGGHGTAFELAAGSGTLRDLGVADVGAGGVTLAANGDLFGVTEFGGVAEGGSAFRVASDGGAYGGPAETVASFAAAAGGIGPYGHPVVDDAGDLFGSTDAGTIYEVPVLRAGPLTFYPSDGDSGISPLSIDGAGDLFAVVANPAGNVGEVVEFASGEGSFPSLLGSTDTLDGGDVRVTGAPVLTAAGHLCGTERAGGAYGGGTVYEVDQDFAPTTPVTLAVSSPVLASGEKVTLTATVGPAAAGGTVEFEDDQSGPSDLGTATVSPDGTAMLTVALGEPLHPEVGEHPIVADYQGQAGSPAGTSAAVDVDVRAGYGTVAVSVSDGGRTTSVAQGQPITFTATVTGTPPIDGVTPTGSVTFYRGSAPIGTATLDAAGQAVFTTAALPVGTADVSASYDGDGAYLFTATPSAPVAVAVVGPGLVPSLALGGASDTVPAAGVAGAAVSATVRVAIRNSLAAAERGTATVAVYLSADDMLDTSDDAGPADVQVGVARPRLALPPGGVAIVSLPIRQFPGQLTAGSYHLLVVATDANRRLNVAELPATVTLAAADRSLSAELDGTPTDLNPRKLVLTITNTGNIELDGKLTLDLSLSDSTTQSPPVANNEGTVHLRVGGTVRVRLPPVPRSALPPGGYQPNVLVSLAYGDFGSDVVTAAAYTTVTVVVPD